MHRDEEHRRVLPEHRLRAVAVVDVPVDDRDPLRRRAFCACRAAIATLLNRQKPIASSCEEWWPGGRTSAKPFSTAAIEHGVGHVAACTRRQQRRLPACGPIRASGPTHAYSPFAHAASIASISRGVWTSSSSSRVASRDSSRVSCSEHAGAPRAPASFESAEPAARHGRHRSSLRPAHRAPSSRCHAPDSARRRQRRWPRCARYPQPLKAPSPPLRFPPPPE